jgi:hypothetical protein
MAWDHSFGMSLGAACADPNYPKPHRCYNCYVATPDLGIEGAVCRYICYIATRPVNVALVIDVECIRTKSSVDSNSNFPADSGGMTAAIFWSGSTVLKKKGVCAAAGPSRRL